MDLLSVNMSIDRNCNRELFSTNPVQNVQLLHRTFVDDSLDDDLFETSALDTAMIQEPGARYARSLSFSSSGGQSETQTVENETVGTSPDNPPSMNADKVPDVNTTQEDDEHEPGPSGVNLLCDKVGNNRSMQDDLLPESPIPGPSNITASIPVIIADDPDINASDKGTTPRNTASKDALESVVNAPRKKQKHGIQTKRKNKQPKEVTKTDTAAKQSFNSGFLTLKAHISQLQIKNGKPPNFAIFMEDNLHDPEAKPAKETAGRIIAFAAGDMRKEFFENGLKYDPIKYAFMENGYNFKEDKNAIIEWGRIKRKRSRKVTSSESDSESDSESEKPRKKKKKVIRKRKRKEVDEEEMEETEIVNLATEEPGDENQENHNPSKPPSDKEESSDGGIHQYGRGFKVVDQQKKNQAENQKKENKKKKEMVANDAMEDSSDQEKELSKKAPIGPAKRKSKEQTKPKGKKKVGKPRTQTVTTPVLGRKLNRNKFV